MSTYVLVPGAGGEAWYWSRVVPLLRAAGHEAIAVGLPADDEDATLDDYAQTILDAIDGQQDVVLVAQSMGAFSAPLAAARAETDAVTQLALVAPMIPASGESVDAWWSTTKDIYGWEMAEAFDPVRTFFHDVPQETVDEALSRGEPRQGEAACAQPWPLAEWPDDIPTRAIVGRDDRLFPYAFARAIAQDRLGVEPAAIDSGHLPALAKPRELVEWLVA